MTPATINAAQVNNVAAVMTANTGAAKSGFADDYGIQQGSHAETRESWALNQYSMEGQLIQYDVLEDLALPDGFLDEYYSQVRDLSVIFHCSPSFSPQKKTDVSCFRV